MSESNSMKRFIHDEAGAVSVDWTVLTSALVGLGMAATGVVTQGISATSTATANELSGFSFFSPFGELLFSGDFTGGDRGPWQGGSIVSISGFGEILALSGAASEAQAIFSVDEGFDTSVIEFDMIIGDSWDHETGEISVNGDTVLLSEFAWRDNEPTITTINTANDTTVTLVDVSDSSGNSSANWATRRSSNDYVYAVQITTANDGAGEVVLGASTTLNSNHRDEFFGIDNVEVTGR